MQSQILTTHPQARLRVYAIWVNKQAGDACSRWDAAGLTDPRVVLAQAIVAEGAGQKRPAHRPAARAAGGRHRHRGIVAPCLRFPLGGAYLPGRLLCRQPALDREGELKMRGS